MGLGVEGEGEGEGSGARLAHTVLREVLAELGGLVRLAAVGAEQAATRVVHGDEAHLVRVRVRLRIRVRVRVRVRVGVRVRVRVGVRVHVVRSTSSLLGTPMIGVPSLRASG